MTKNTTRADTSLKSLWETISLLEVADKHQLLELLEFELFPDDEDSPEDMAEIQAARNDYQAGDYTNLDQYVVQLQKMII
jgi:hypothetical protein